jgi:tRNA A37 threonylcarbamoyladenosine dehydratase
MTAKCHLIATCKARGIPIVSSMGAAGRMDPTRIQVADLNRTHHDAMGAHVRAILREKHGFPSRRLWDIPAVFSDEAVSPPKALAYENGEGFKCVCPQGENDFLTCEKRSRIDGSASFVTGAFGLAAASVVVRKLTE